jgi:hypothetical protein
MNITSGTARRFTSDMELSAPFRGNPNGS